MANVDRLNMVCRHRAGFTYNKLNRLKARASQKMGGLITNSEDLFFSLYRYFQWKTEHLRTCIPFFVLHDTKIFSENRTSEDVKTFFFALPISVIKQPRASHCLNPVLRSVFRGGHCAMASFLTLPFSKKKY